MHETNLEERLRSLLRREGDGLPFTITTDELERRLALRRRARNGQRLGLLAAGLAVMAVGSVFALGSGWLRGSNVAADPSASPSAIPAPTPAPTPAVTPRPTDRIGSVGIAVLVTPTGEDSRRPNTFELTTVDPSTGTATALATIPGRILPEDGWLDGGERPPQVTATGWLAIPFTRGPNEDERGPAIAIVDIRAAAAEPWIIDGYEIRGWNPADELVVEQQSTVSIASPASRSVERVAIQGDAARVSAISADAATPFLATSSDEAERRGYLDLDGNFTASDDQPAVYQRTGRERPVGADGHGLGPACDSGPDDASSGCWLVETNAAHEPIATWVDIEAESGFHDFAWASDGKSAWLLLDGGTVGGGAVASLAYSASPGARVERARIDFAKGASPTILGFADEPAPGSATVVAIGDRDGFTRAFVLENGTVVMQEGTAWFAGWADDPAPYDPD